MEGKETKEEENLTETKYRITRGYYKIPFTKINEDGTKEREEGGFIEDWFQGHLWVFVKIEGETETGLAMDMELSKLSCKIDEILKKEKSNG